MRALYRLVRNLVVLPFVPLLMLVRLLTRPSGPWLSVKLRAELAELERPRSRVLSVLQMLNPRPKRTSLWVLRQLTRRIARDPRIHGLIIEVPPLHAGWATVAGVRQLVEDLVNSGKQVVVWLPQGGGNRELYLATAASTVLISPQATFGPLGLAAGVRYFKPLLDKVGIEVEVEARCEFKSAAEPATRERMSEPQRQQLGALLRTIDDALRAAIGQREGMDTTRIDALFAMAFVRGQAAVDAGVADGICYPDQLAAKVCGKTGKEARLGDADDYLSWHRARFFAPLRRPRYVAVVQVRGPIVQTAPTSVLTRQRRTAVMEHVVGALRKAAEDRRAVGVLLHVDSPGGSALASDLIHQEVVALKRKKPVVAWFGEVAASGGYYVAASADRIIAQPVGITGSIGVIMAKVVSEQLLDKLGVRVETLRLAPHADLLSSARRLSEAERAILAREADGFYEAFVDVVAAGREKPADAIEPLARGRVWSGRDAIQCGLVDGSGGFALAVGDVLSRAGVSADANVEPIVVAPPRERLPPIVDEVEALGWGALADLRDLTGVLMADERALYYAPGLPIVR